MGLSILKNRILIIIGTLSFLILLFLFPTLSLNGAKSGLLLWFNVVVPTLLPFLIISNLIIHFHITSIISSLVYPIFHRLLGLSKDGCYPIIIGMLSGYPVGAKSCGDLVIERKITKKEGQFLLSFCNNASPMFITSFVALQGLSLPQHRYAFLFIIYSCSFLSGILFYLFPHKKEFSATTKTDLTQAYGHIEAASLPNNSSSPFCIIDSSILNSFEILTKVGGYIILFSILANIFSAISILPEVPKLLCIGILEITTGISAIVHSSLNIATKTILVLTICAFGGLSALAQTQSVIEKSELSIITYFFVKVFNSFLTMLISFIYIQLFF